MKTKRKAEIKQTLDFLNEMSVDHDIIEKFKSVTGSPEQSEVPVMEIFLDCISGIEPIRLEIILVEYSKRFLQKDDQEIEKAKEIVQTLHIAKKLRAPVDIQLVRRLDDMITVEEALILDEMFNEQLVFQESKKNSNKNCLIGVTHHLIDFDYFTIDKNNPNESIKKALKYLEERWHVKSLREYYRKKNKEKYKALAAKQFPIIDILERKRKGERFDK